MSKKTVKTAPVKIKNTPVKMNLPEKKQAKISLQVLIDYDEYNIEGGSHETIHEWLNELIEKGREFGTVSGTVEIPEVKFEIR